MNRKEYLLNVLGKKHYELNEIDLDYIISDKGWNSLVETLDVKEMFTINERINDKKLEEIGREMNVTKERVRQIEFKACRKLQNRIDYILVADLTKQAVSIREEMQKEISRYKYLLNKLKEKNGELINELGIENEIPKIDILDIPIDKLGFTMRTYHCLYRAGYKEFGDIVKSSEETLLRIRNMGRKSVKEVMELANKYGYELLSESSLEFDLFGKIKR